MTPLNVWLVAGGYLPSPDGRPARVLCGLERIGRDCIRYGVTVTWAHLPGDEPARTYWRLRSIVLAPWVFDVESDALRDVLIHELCHCRLGASCATARHYQMSWYGDILTP